MGVGLHQGGEGQGEAPRRLRPPEGFQADEATVSLLQAHPHQPLAIGGAQVEAGIKQAAGDGEGGELTQGFFAALRGSWVSTNRN